MFGGLCHRDHRFSRLICCGLEFAARASSVRLDPMSSIGPFSPKVPTSRRLDLGITRGGRYRVAPLFHPRLVRVATGQRRDHVSMPVVFMARVSGCVSVLCQRVLVTPDPALSTLAYGRTYRSSTGDGRSDQTGRGTSKAVADLAGVPGSASARIGVMERIPTTNAAHLYRVRAALAA